MALVPERAAQRAVDALEQGIVLEFVADLLDFFLGILGPIGDVQDEPFRAIAGGMQGAQERTPCRFTAAAWRRDHVAMPPAALPLAVERVIIGVHGIVREGADVRHKRFPKEAQVPFARQAQALVHVIAACAWPALLILGLVEALEAQDGLGLVLCLGLPLEAVRDTRARREAPRGKMKGIGHGTPSLSPSSLFFMQHCIFFYTNQVNCCKIISIITHPRPRTV